ncbi:toxin-antitoxin system YwqK family antitoxin [Mucilaginibacter sp. AK015]|uniref:toxin-antitoxin system YwqK family antitoxin n=1 Tax=Mucilaginibacter sp. AK015 TaxID=2723072 RepID=UPI00162120E7|nr:hypothetical protein [Mucilaginibacter sp. AK015]MBB5395981.1 antitoxin component YwqK of YwqJK toxin-antitoxin module [Mucilaginibacter sp. AK015]
MRSFLITFFTAFCACAALAQQVTPPVQRSIRFDFISGDSTRLSFNEDFNLIEDSCSQVYRYAHVNIQTRRYTGPFRDVSKADANLLITQGTYTPEGLKEGPFTINYLNGTLQAKGNFKNGLFDGRWEVFYDNGKPKITFEADGKDIKIIDEWDAKGNRTVNNGNGTYRADMGFIYWKGKLLNGKPEGKWKSKKTSDDSDLTTEVYKNGVFQGGSTSVSEYHDASRMVLISPDIFPFTNAEKLQISLTPCNGVKPGSVVNASYIGGTASFNDHIAELTNAFIKNGNLWSISGQITLDGEVNERGAIFKLKNRDPGYSDLAQALISKLRSLPNLQPATVNGKPVKQGFTITYTFQTGSYRYSYRFLPIRP